MPPPLLSFTSMSNIGPDYQERLSESVLRRGGTDFRRWIRQGNSLAGPWGTRCGFIFAGGVRGLGALITYSPVDFASDRANPTITVEVLYPSLVSDLALMKRIMVECAAIHTGEWTLNVPDFWAEFCRSELRLGRGRRSSLPDMQRFRLRVRGPETPVRLWTDVRRLAPTPKSALDNWVAGRSPGYRDWFNDLNRGGMAPFGHRCVFLVGRSGVSPLALVSFEGDNSASAASLEFLSSGSVAYEEIVRLTLCEAAVIGRPGRWGLGVPDSMVPYMRNLGTRYIGRDTTGKQVFLFQVP